MMLWRGSKNFISSLLILWLSVCPIWTGHATGAPSDAGAITSSAPFAAAQLQLHPKKVIVENVEGVWFSKDEAVAVLNALHDREQIRDIETLTANALALSQSSVRSATSAAAQLKLADANYESLLAQCRSSLQSETDRCESIWRQPVLPLGLGLVAGAAMCIGVANALPRGP